MLETRDSGLGRKKRSYSRSRLWLVPLTRRSALSQFPGPTGHSYIHAHTYIEYTSTTVHIWPPKQSAPNPPQCPSHYHVSHPLQHVTFKHVSRSQNQQGEEQTCPLLVGAAQK